MKLAEPAFLFLLILVPLLALGGWLAERQRRTAWQTLVAPRLRKKLAAPASPLTRWLSLGTGLLGLILLIITLAQPIAGEQETVSLVKGRNILIAVDASRSMLVRDVAPDRLNAAKTAVFDLLDSFPNDRIGLLAFAGSAALQAPLTIDHNALRETLDQLDETNVPSGGSNLAEAINLATKTFQETGQRNHALIVMSDGELHEGELEDASFDARQAGVFVVTIGIGTLEGDFVPDPNESDGRFRDRSGRPVLSRLNPAPLRTLAGDTGGLYLEGVGGDFTEKIDTVIERLDAFEDEGRVQIKSIPRFQWFLIPSLLLMITSLLLRFLSTPSRPRAVTATPLPSLILILLTCLALSPQSPAWTNPLEGFLGTRQLKKGNPEAAQEHFEKAAQSANSEQLARIRYGQGVAFTEMENYPRAAEAFSEALLSESPSLQRDAYSQLGNSLYLRALEEVKADNSQLEKPISYLEDALHHYRSALDIDPEHQPSIKNKAATEKALEQLKEIQQQQQPQQQEQEQQESGEENEPQENEPQDSDSQDQEGDKGENSEQQDGEDGDQKNGEEGEDQQQDGQNEGDEEGQKNEEPEDESGQSRDEGEEQDAKGQPNQQGDQREGPAPREGETAEQFARRILEENADFQKDALRKRGSQAIPTKDW